MARFHVRARTVDMLGRQQIAGIPTAISELFKNAHDAYAKKVEVDYFREDDLLVIRDDGLGMTRNDFEKRWLTLGTESKLGPSHGLSPPPRDPDQPKRPILGEKGIGRLAIAILGPQLFVLTRARKEGVPDDKLVAAFLNWRLFELPGIDLDDIEIPVREFPAAILPDGAAVKEMAVEYSYVLDKVVDRIDQDSLATIRRDLEEFDLDPRKLSADLGLPSLSGEGTGTHFFVKPMERLVQDDMDTRESNKATKDSNKPTNFEKHLLGFTNTMTPGSMVPPIVARFRDYPDEGAPRELLGESAFFTPEEFLTVDHRIEGRFDEYGQFQGNVRVYQMKPDSYVLNWNEGVGRKTLCGPFALSVAILQGERSATLVPPEEYARMSKKTERLGGLYIYRDGIRVQPYGGADYDWLDIERRRTLGAGYYYYSFRRMFGAIELTSAANGALNEKAGREGFSENSAYRQFRSILINFFLQSAADFFREEGARSDGWEQKRQELQEADAKRRHRERQVKAKKHDFERSLGRFFSGLDGQVIEKETEKTLAAVKRNTDQVLRSKRDSKAKALALMRIERDGRGELQEIRKRSIIVKPRVGLSRKLSNQWLDYSQEFERLENEVLRPIELQIEEYVSTTAEKCELPFHRFLRIDSAVRQRSKKALGTVRSLKKESDTAISKVAAIAQSTARDSFRTMNSTVDEVLAELESLKRERIGDGPLVEKRREFEQKIDSVCEHERMRLLRMKEQLNELGQSWADAGFDSIDIVAALEEELEELRDQRDIDLEMVQIGMAVSIVSHEFEKTVGALRDGFRRMSAWAHANPDLDDLYRNMRGAFDHLDGYLSMFTPFDRRLYGNKAKIHGAEIYKFIGDLFERRLERHSVALTQTEAFREAAVFGYYSTFFSVFANLIDNSIFWLRDIKDRPREIILDASNGALVIRDNGSGVWAGDRSNIFSLRFSRKPGGRGMGLYISRAALHKDGWDLTLEGGKPSAGAAFRISRLEESNAER